LSDPIDRRLMLGAAGLLGAAALSRVASAGPLNPPAGPVTPTGKSLTDIEPRTAVNDTNTPGDGECVHRITQPGSYYLTGNVAGQSGKHGIIIDASNVTLDLMGFALLGVPGSLEGVRCVGRHAVTIRNGSIRGFGGVGLCIDFENPGMPGAGAIVEHITCTDNASSGIFCQQTNGLVRSCTADRNGDIGIYAYRGVVRSCSARENAAGIVINRCSAVLGCSARQNTVGIQSEAGSILADCTAYENTNVGMSANNTSLHSCTASTNGLDGISATQSGLVRACTARGNTGSGFNLSPFLSFPTRARLEGSTSTDNGIGVRALGTLSILSRNTCSGNATNWNVAGQNFARVVQATTSGAVNGNGGGVAPSTETSPHLNFTY